MKSYFYSLLRRYLSLSILPQNSVVELDPANDFLVRSFPNSHICFKDTQPNLQGLPSHFRRASLDKAITFTDIATLDPDYIVISAPIHAHRDLQALLREVHLVSKPHTRLIIIYYSSLWSPMAKLATWLGLREKTQRANWLTHEDLHNLLVLENFDLIKREQKVLMPFHIPLLSDWINRYIAPLPLIKHLCLVNIAIARPVFPSAPFKDASVSIVVPARNEAGNIEAILQRIPKMGPDDEIIFIEGGSKDKTWETILACATQSAGHSGKRILSGRQTGKGKGDAVRLGFSMAKNPILMILDADMTVPPEDLPKFYRAITEGKGEFINGSRLVYPMEKRAMRFFNLLGNKFFAAAFSFVLGQPFKDTLCGTKVISKANYEALAANRHYFGDFDPFGDFDLIFGAARMGLKIVEVPITYRERTYGSTNISRWRHGVILLTMLVFSARRIKFL